MPVCVLSDNRVVECGDGDGRSVYRPGIDRCICVHYDAPEAVPKEIVAVVLALAGIFVIATHGNPGTLVLSRRALIMGLLSAFAVVVYTVQPVELLKQYEAPMILAWGMLIGGTVLMLAFQPWNHMPIVDAKMIEIVLYIIVFGTMAGFSMYMQSVKLIGGVKGRAVCLHRAGSRRQFCRLCG